MPSTRDLSIALLTVLLIGGCATSGVDKSLKESAAVSPEEMREREDTSQHTTAPLDAAQREALDNLLELMRAGEWPTAREMAQELLLAQPMMAEAYANMGSIHFQLDELEKAEQAWLKALQFRPGWAAVSNRLGIFYRQQGRFDEALKMYQQAIGSEDTYTNAHRNIAILYEIYLGEYEMALQHYRRYQQLQGDAGEEAQMWIADLERRIERSTR